MNWKEVSVEINSQAAEAVANIMNELGSGGVVIANFNDRIKISGYYYNDAKFTELIDKLKIKINKLSTYNLDTGKIFLSVSDKRNEDWATAWHEYFKPLEIGKSFIISPSWENIKDTRRKIIKIDPGMAFGIGGHETTQMCIELLERYIVNKTKQKTMLDIGTGTGILSIVGAYLGIDNIIGIDIDPAAVEAARRNIKINQVEDKVKIQKGDMIRDMDMDGKYSLITANLLPNLIMSLLPSLPPLMKKNSKLILSGIITDKRDSIVNGLKELNLKLIEEKSMNEWVSLVVVQECV